MPSPQEPFAYAGLYKVFAMSQTAQELVSSQCTLCPAGCRINLAAAGPDAWRSEYPLDQQGGLCPRGSALGELLCHPLRIVEPAIRAIGKLQPTAMPDALQQILDQGQDSITFLLDGSLPCEQLIEAAAWCSAWPAADVCFVTEPAETQLLLGLEAGKVSYLGVDDLADCDGFVIIGDAFAANPICARGVMDRRKSQPRTPIVAIDPAAGTAAKFATHRVETAPGMELQAIAAVAVAAGVNTGKLVDAKAAAKAVPSADSAGKAIANCKRLAVLIAAEHGRSHAWRQIGYVAAKLGGALGGGTAPQTSGANALAAVRLAERLDTTSLAKAISSDSLLVAVGCDVLGMLGIKQPKVFAAAASLPNTTTDQAKIVLPAAMACELGGTYLLDACRNTQITPLLQPPAGVASPAEIIAALAQMAGTAKPDLPSVDLTAQLAARTPSAAAAADGPSGLTLLLGRQPSQAGCGALTAHGSWQQAMQVEPEVKVSTEDARRAGLADLQLASVSVDGLAVSARVRVVAELSSGVIVLPEGISKCRALLPCSIDKKDDILVSTPSTAALTSE